MTAHQILIALGLFLALVSIFKPSWPLLAVAVILICADLLTR